MDDIKLFPSTSIEALALLYCEKHANESTTAAELAVMYKDALKEIKEANRRYRSTQPAK